MPDTTNLQLPLMAASQAQKHVTYNEAMEQLDDVLGGSAMLKTLTEELTGLSGATAETTIEFPNQCIILGASVRVTTLITGATSFDAGDGSTADRFGGSLGVAVDSTNQGTVGPSGNYSGLTVTLTANGGNFTAGAVKVSLHFIELAIPPA